MDIAIASGKGGTGKTTIAVNLALALAETQPVTLLDCDVEEPNCNLFLKIQDLSCKKAEVPSFDFDNELCSRCRKCADVCRFNAIAVMPSGVMFFPELCHGCGGCILSCGTGAITEKTRAIGEISSSEQGLLRFADGRLNVGETMAPPLIRTLKEQLNDDGLNIMDCPPGTSCAMITAVRDSDIVILVTEPTPFGLNDLRLAVAALREMAMPFVVIVNRDGVGDDQVKKYCSEEQIKIVAAIPDSREIAEIYARGETLYGRHPEFSNQIDVVVKWLKQEAGQ
jgi:MinD superfamily P-loop ATPase